MAYVSVALRSVTSMARSGPGARQSSECFKGDCVEAESEPRISMQQGQSCVCVWGVWKGLATPGELVPVHSVWMEVISSGGQPATETQCVTVWISYMTEYYIFFPLPCT